MGGGFAGCFGAGAELFGVEDAERVDGAGGCDGCEDLGAEVEGFDDFAEFLAGCGGVDDGDDLGDGQFVTIGDVAECERAVEESAEEGIGGGVELGFEGWGRGRGFGG